MMDWHTCAWCGNALEGYEQWMFTSADGAERWVSCTGCYRKVWESSKDRGGE